MKRFKLFTTFAVLLFATTAFAVNPKGWVNIKRGKGITVPAPGIQFTPHADPPTHSDLNNDVMYLDTDGKYYVRKGGAWVDITVQAGASLDLDGAFDNGKIINGANSSGNAMQVGDGTDAILMHTEAAGDVRITTNGTSDLTIVPDGGDTDITGTLDVSGAVTVGGTLNVVGDFTVNTNKLTVTASNGNTAIAGTLAVTSTSAFSDAITVSSGGANITGGLTSDAHTIGSGNLTLTIGDVVISSGELDVTGNASNTDTVDITRSASATGGDAVDIDMGSATVSGDAIDIGWGGAGTGDALNINMASNVAGGAINIAASGARTGPIIDIANAGTDTGTDDHVINILQSGAQDSNIVNLAFGTANSPGNAISVDMDTNLAGEGLFIDEGGTARTGSAIEVNADGTGTHSVIDMNISGNAAITGIDIDGTFNGSPAGNALDINLDDGDNLDTGLMSLVVGTGARSALIVYTGTQTDSGTTSHVIDINQTGVLDSNVIDITYDTGVSTGQAVDINMGSNVAGMAVSIASAATGIDNEGSGIDIDASGALVQGANVLRIDSAGNMAHADTRVVEINETGANQASSYTVAVTSTNNGGLIISSAAADNAIDIVQGIVDLSGNKLLVFDAATGIYGQADTFIDLFADGGMRFGDSSGGAPTNYTNISATGSITLVGSARETKTIWIPAQDFQNVSGAAQGLVGIAGVWQLSDAASDSLTTTFYVPNGYVEGTNMTVKVHWSSAEISNTAVFDGAWLPVVAGEDTSAAGNLFTQEDDAAAGTADFLNITEGFAITNATIDKGDQVILNLLRLGSDGNDDLTDDVDFQGAAITYTADRI